jgi:hypothetical protein
MGETDCFFSGIGYGDKSSYLGTTKDDWGSGKEITNEMFFQAFQTAIREFASTLPCPFASDTSKAA